LTLTGQTITANDPQSKRALFSNSLKDSGSGTRSLKDCNLRLPKALVRLFETHLEKSDFQGPGDFIFCNSAGEPFNQNRVRENVLQKAMDKIGIKGERNRSMAFTSFDTVRAQSSTLELVT
jgi:hypothetical protein